MYSRAVALNDTQASHWGSESEMESLPWSCDFGAAQVNYCNMTNALNGEVEFTPHEGLTPTEGTGPPPDTSGKGDFP